MKHLAFIFLLFIFCTSALGQSAGLRIPIWFTDLLGAIDPPDTLRFGFHPNATSCLDDSLGEEAFPDECGLFSLHCADFKKPPRMHCPTDFPNFLDLRRWWGANQIDTFEIRVIGPPPIVMHWPQNLSSELDSCFLFAFLTPDSWQIINIDMLKIDSAIVSFDSTYAIFMAIFRTVGPKVPASVENSLLLAPSNWSLSANYPNPFNPATTFKLHLPHRANAIARVFDVLGRLIATPISVSLPAGVHEFSWDGRDGNGLPVGAGVYFLQVTASFPNSTNVSSTRKMMLLK